MRPAGAGETVATKPAFRSAFKSRRCLVPASGFFEWQKLDDGKTKQPYYIHATSGTPFFFAGLWEQWSPPDAERVETFTIITTEPNEMMAKLHDRMPVILDPKSFDAWLDPKTSPETVAGLIAPYPTASMTCHPVSTIVNSPRNNVPECVVPSAA